MENHYKILGVESSATPQEIRRAYRILARRYHPDVNPGADSEERFKRIAEAYRVLSEESKRRQYDIELEAAERNYSHARMQQYRQQQRDRFQARSRYFEAQAAATAAKKKKEQASARSKKVPARSQVEGFDIKTAWNRISKSAKDLWNAKGSADTAQGVSSKSTSPREARIQRLSIIEASVNIFDAINGVKKTVEIEEPEGPRKVSVSIPPGVHDGSVVRMRSKKGARSEELVVIVRVSSHPTLSIERKGLIIQTPITVAEAIKGANITVPGFDSAMVVKVPPGSQSGQEIRMRDQGIKHSDGSRGDIFYRLQVKVPESSTAVGIQDKATELDLYYESSVRSTLGQSIMELKN